MAYTLTPKQLDKLKTQLHGKESSLLADTKITNYSLTRDLRKVLIVSALILTAQFILLRFI